MVVAKGRDRAGIKRIAPHHGGDSTPLRGGTERSQSRVCGALSGDAFAFPSACRARIGDLRSCLLPPQFAAGSRATRPKNGRPITQSPLLRFARSSIGGRGAMNSPAPCCRATWSGAAGGGGWLRRSRKADPEQPFDAVQLWFAWENVHGRYGFCDGGRRGFGSRSDDRSSAKRAVGALLLARSGLRSGYTVSGIS